MSSCLPVKKIMSSCLKIMYSCLKIMSSRQGTKKRSPKSFDSEDLK